VLTRLVAALVLPPAGPLLLLAVALLLRWAGRRRLALGLASVSVLALLLLSTPLVADLLARGLEREVPPVAVGDLPEAEAIVVLGGGIAPALWPRAAPELSGAADRVLHAARLWRAGKAPLVVASGGTPEATGAPVPEAEAMKALLVEWGVAEDRVVVEAGSLDTRQNAVLTAALLRERGATRVLLVTSALHMPRALAAFRATGLAVTPAPTDYLVVEGRGASLSDVLPSADALMLSSRALHERLGRLWYRLRGWE
jgi:uncharacterized SAM-binding protein YcdF (DUF218 family)